MNGWSWLRMFVYALPRRVRLLAVLALGVALLVLWLNTAAPAGRELAARNRSLMTATAAAEDGRYPYGTPAPNGPAPGP